MTTSGTASDSEGQHSAKSDNEWQGDTANDNKWQQITRNNKKMTMGATKWTKANGSKSNSVILSFKMKQKTSLVPEDFYSNF